MQGPSKKETANQNMEQHRKKQQKKQEQSQKYYPGLLYDESKQYNGIVKKAKTGTVAK